MKHVSVVVLNWNGWKDTIECLKSLCRSTYPNYDVIVVDNGSQDDSTVRIQAWMEARRQVRFQLLDDASDGSQIITSGDAGVGTGTASRSHVEKTPCTTQELTLIRNQQNLGFARGNNVGMRHALHGSNAEYVVVLNNDTVVDENLIVELARCAENDEGIGAVAPVIYSYNYPDKVLDSSGGRMNFWTGRFHSMPNDVKQTTDIEMLRGPCYLLKRRAIERAGMFDKNFFLFWEEYDLSFRIRQRGYRICYTPYAKVWHKGGAGTTRNPRLWFYHQMRSPLFFMRKHATRAQYYFFIVAFILTTPSFAARIVIQHRDLSLFKALIAGIRDGASEDIEAST